MEKTRRDFLKTAGAAALGAGAVITGTRKAHAQVRKDGVTNWKGQSCFTSTTTPFGPFGPKEAGLNGGCYLWTEWLKKATGGRLLIDWAEPGAIVANAEVDMAVRKNTVQISHGLATYYSGRVPEADIESGGVFIWEDSDQSFQCLFKYGFYQAVQRVYDKFNIKYIPFFTNSIQGIGTNFPALNPQSLKGKKIRAAGMWGDYVQMLGGSPVPIPWGEIYMGMKLGTIDGWVGGSAALEELKLKEVTKGFINYPNMANVNCNLLINKDAFKALPPDIQAVLERDAPYVTYACASNWRNQCNWVLKDSMQKYGLKLYAWPDEDVKRIVQQTFDVIYPNVAKRSKACEELLEIVKKQMRDYGRLK